MGLPVSRRISRGGQWKAGSFVRSYAGWQKDEKTETEQPPTVSLKRVSSADAGATPIHPPPEADQVRQGCRRG